MFNFDINSIFGLLVLILSITIHECAHAAMAYYLGDSTGKYAGRMTLNPIPHIDPIGTIIAPLFFGIGWAKPVPFNPYNLKDQKNGPMLIALAGPFSNLALALIFGLIIRVLIAYGINSQTFIIFVVFLGSIVKFNILLAVFNLVPVPPLDGSKILYAILPDSSYQIKAFLEQYSIVFLLLFVVFFSSYIIPVVDWVFNFIVLR